MQPGDKVQFNCDFANGDVLVERGDVGEVRATLGALGYLSVVAKGMIWLCKPHEIRPAGTSIPQAHKDAMRADQELASDFLKWLATQEGETENNE